MPPIPPGGIAGAFSFSGISVTSASVVSNRPAIDDAGLYQIDIFTLGDVVTFVAFALLHFLDNERAFRAGVVGQLTHRLFDRATHDLDADFFVGIEASHVFERFLGADECDTATRDDAFLDRSPRGVQR